MIIFSFSSNGLLDHDDLSPIQPFTANVMREKASVGCWMEDSWTGLIVKLENLSCEILGSKGCFSMHFKS